MEEHDGMEVQDGDAVEYMWVDDINQNYCRYDPTDTNCEICQELVRISDELEEDFCKYLSVISFT